MAKQFYIPAMDKVEDVLDLLTNQEKYIKYMQDLLAIRNEVNETLGTVKTKAEAERVLAEAFDAQGFATKLREEAIEESKKLKAAAQAEYDKATQTRVNEEKRYTEWEQQLKAVEFNLKAERRNLEDRQREFIASVKSEQARLEEAYQKLVAEQAELKAKREKLDAAFAALGS